MTEMDTALSNRKQLTQEEINSFMVDGCLVVRDVFPREMADQIIPLVCAELKMDIYDPSTWPKHLVALQRALQRRANKSSSDQLQFTPIVILKKSLEEELVSGIYTQRYYGVIGDLCGFGRWQMSKRLDHWPILLPLFKDHPWHPLEGGWHLDGDFDRMSIHSANMGLIVIHLFTDIQSGGGGTTVRLGSHRYTVSILAGAGRDGLDKGEIIARVVNATKHLPVKELTGNAGDLILMHPWAIHTSSLNTTEQVQLAANKHIHLFEPMKLLREEHSEYSPVELAVVDSISEYRKNTPQENSESAQRPGTCENRLKQGGLRFHFALAGFRKLREVRTRDLLRIAVLRSNAYWPLSILYRQPYHLAIKAFVKLCCTYPEIKSVYLRHPLVEGNWTPGLSDIDLTIITREGIVAEQEFDFLRSFWKKFRRIKKLFPMYGEIYVLSEAYFELWQEVEFEGSNAPNWSLLCGSEVIGKKEVTFNDQFQSQAFDHAFGFYLNYFLAKFNRRSISSRLVLYDLLRTKNKILRCLDRLQGQEISRNGQLPQSVMPQKTELLYTVIRGLEKSLERWTAVKNPSPPSKINIQWQAEADAKNNLLIDTEAIDLSKLSPWHGELESVYLNYHKKIFIVLKNGLDQQSFSNCLEAIGEAFSAEGQLPVIVNTNLFRYFLREYKPFEYGHFITFRTLVFGTDILPDIAPPDRSAFKNYLLKGAAEVLKFPSCQKLFLSPMSKWHSSQEFVHISDSALLIRFRLEHGSIKPWYREILQDCYEAYPEYAEKLENLRTRAKSSQEKDLQLEWFTLFKRLANDVQKSILASDTLLFSSKKVKFQEH